MNEMILSPVRLTDARPTCGAWLQTDSPAPQALPALVQAAAAFGQRAPVPVKTALQLIPAPVSGVRLLLCADDPAAPVSDLMHMRDSLLAEAEALLRGMGLTCAAVRALPDIALPVHGLLMLLRKRRIPFRQPLQLPYSLDAPHGFCQPIDAAPIDWRRLTALSKGDPASGAMLTLIPRTLSGSERRRIDSALCAAGAPSEYLRAYRLLSAAGQCCEFALCLWGPAAMQPWDTLTSPSAPLTPLPMMAEDAVCEELRFDPWALLRRIGRSESPVSPGAFGHILTAEEIRHLCETDAPLPPDAPEK